MPSSQNQLLYGDNLGIMRDMPDESVDLIYLDPPFNSQRNYNIIYKNATGLPVPEQNEAFCDTWEMDAEKEDLVKRMPQLLKKYQVSSELVGFWDSWITALRYNRPQLLAYLVYMTVRLLEMHRILKSDGSIYLHCDTHASHYLKVVMDGIFGSDNFVNEIIWERIKGAGKRSQHEPRSFGRSSDRLLFYSKARQHVFSLGPIMRPYDDLEKDFPRQDTKGRYKRRSPFRPLGLGPRPNLCYDYKGVFPPHPSGWTTTKENLARLDESGEIEITRDGTIWRKQRPREGIAPNDVWTDIPQVAGKENLGYPTQKPIELLERIIRASSNENGVIFDPFCGCGTTIYAAHLNRRRWIGCDITILAVRLVKEILEQRHNIKEGKGYEINGIPNSVESAMGLFKRDHYQFQHWAVEKVHGFPNSKGAGDRGVDGRIWFQTDEGLRAMAISVKGGASGKPVDIRELRGVIEREINTEMGGFICFKSPTKEMREEASKAGFYEYRGEKYNRLQILTVKDLIEDKIFNTLSKVRGMEKERGTLL